MKSAFDEEFLRVPCFRLQTPIATSDFRELGQLGLTKPGFVDAKIPASVLVLSRNLLKRGFRKICTQVALRHDLSRVPAAPSRATLCDSLDLADDLIIAHARNFEASRFHQDWLLPRKMSDALYVQWIRNSLSGSKRVVRIGSNFATFSDRDGVRSIDLLSVLEKHRGVAGSLLSSLLLDARSKACSFIDVTTEAENAAALATYRKVGFDIVGHLNVFHRYKPK